METKICSRCKRLLSVENFAVRVARKSGRHSACKECEKKRYFNPEKNRLAQRRYRARHQERLKKQDWQERLDILNLYGGKCSCCGEDRPEFLAIDHINGDGSKERKQGITGVFLMRVLSKERVPRIDLRVLCHNCNASKGYYGYCPHEHPGQNFIDLAMKFRLNRAAAETKR